MPPKRSKKVQRGGMMMISPQYRQMGNPYAGVQTGEGWWSDAWDGVKNVAKGAYNFVKDNKLISTGLSLVPDARAQAAAKIASQTGFGKRRVRKNVLKF